MYRQRDGRSTSSTFLCMPKNIDSDTLDGRYSKERPEIDGWRLVVNALLFTEPPIEIVSTWNR